MGEKYQGLRKKLREQTRKCRDRDVRIKVELILLAHKLGSVSEACSRRGFSREFYYKWWRRLKRSGFNIEMLRELRRRPKRSPRRKSWRMEKRIWKIHEKGYGAPMIQALLARDGVKVAVSTISHILNHRRKPRKRRFPRLKAHRRRYELHVPGERIQLDVKYVPELVNGRKAYVYVGVDECTRYRLAYAYDSICEGATVDFLEKMKRFFPFKIQCIQTDNGMEFTYRLNPLVRVEHKMDTWCNENGIRHRCIPPGEKELNGKVERSHRIDEQYFYWKAPTSDLEGFNEALSEWIKHYNTHRPHGGLQFKTPLQKLLEKQPELSGPRAPLPKPSKEQRLIEKVELQLRKLKYAA